MTDGRVLFVTGTDTGVGKTQVSRALLARGRASGLTVIGLKPVASGCGPGPTGLTSEDALALRREASIALPYERVNPYAFAPPIAPHLAAEAIGARVDLETIAGTVAAAVAVADLVVVEGVGGWLVPLGGATTVADLACRLGAPVVLVVGLRLGCLSHALLTAESILHRGARLAGWVANTLDPGMAALEGNVRSLQARLPAPLLGTLPHAPGAPAGELAARLSLPP